MHAPSDIHWNSVSLHFRVTNVGCRCDDEVTWSCVLLLILCLTWSSVSRSCAIVGTANFAIYGIFTWFCVCLYVKLIYNMKQIKNKVDEDDDDDEYNYDDENDFH